MSVIVNKSWVPNTKVLTVGASGTIATFIIDVLQNRVGLDLTNPETAMIVLLVGVASAFFMPERSQGNQNAEI